MDLPTNTHIRLRAAILDALSLLVPGLRDDEELTLAQAAVDAMVKVADEPVMAKDDGGPAFPRAAIDSHDNAMETINEPGMSTRTWQAGQAMKGMLSCQDFVNELCEVAGSQEEARKRLARFACLQADALLEELEKDR